MKSFITSKKRKVVCILSIMSLLLISVVGYCIYKNIQDQKTLSSMNIIFTEITEIEYGTKDYDVQEELVKEIKDATLKEVPKVDTSKIGEQVLKFILTQDNLEKEVEYKITIKDTKAPEIKFKEDSIELTVGDEFDIKSNIESVKDIVDGDIKENEEALELNKKATEEYNKLNKEDIKDDTKIAEKSLNEFLIEDIKDKEEKTLYYKNCYYVDGDIDTDKTGEYTIKVIATDKNGLKAEVEFIVSIHEKVEKSVQSTESNTDIANEQSNSSSNTITKGNVYDVVNTALTQIGKPYLYGASGPDSFDCSGLIYYAYSQNGYSVPRAIGGAGYSIGTNMANAQIGDVIVSPGHYSMISEKKDSGMTHEDMNVFMIRIVQAVENQGVQQTNQYFPLMVRADGKIIGTEGQILDDYPYWSDIRRIQ